MNKKQVAKAYIEAAEAAIKHIEEKGLIEWELFYYLVLKNLHNGVCCYALAAHGKNVYTFKYVNEYKIPGGYWFKTPSSLFSQSENIECLQYRINILKTWL